MRRQEDTPKRTRWEKKLYITTHSMAWKYIYYSHSLWVQREEINKNYAFIPHLKINLNLSTATWVKKKTERMEKGR